MAQLTLYDLVEQGYYQSLSDISRRTGINRGTVSKWCAHRGAKVNDNKAGRIAEKARKPLDYKAIAVFKKRDRWTISPEQGKRFFTTEFAPRVKSKSLSAWLMMFTKVKGEPVL